MGLDKEKVEQYFIQFNGDSNRGMKWVSNWCGLGGGREQLNFDF